MPRRCTVCDHRHVALIDDALVKRGTYRQIATEFGASEEALRRHKREHLPELIAKAHEAQEIARADDLVVELRSIREGLIRLADKAEDAEDYRTAIGGYTSRFKYVELLGEVSEILNRQPQVNILIAPQVQTAIISALEPYPEAKLSVANALEALESHDGS